MLETIFSLTKKNKEENQRQIVNIPVNLIRPNPYQPRKIFDIVSLEELCNSIKTYGLLQPITVRKISEKLYELVAGERRLRAAKIIGMKEIPSIIVNISDDDSALLSLIENSQREQLHFFEEAEAYYNLLKKCNFTQEELAKKIGKNQSTISNKIRLLKLSPIIRKIIFDNNLSERHARAILKINDEKIQFKLLKIICDKNLSVAKTEELIEKTVSKLIGKNKNKKKVTYAYKDIRIFINTIKQAVRLINKSGLNVETYECERDNFIEIKVKVQKNRG